jgi:phosphopantothenoylcysteine decarboxylase
VDTQVNSSIEAINMAAPTSLTTLSTPDTSDIPTLPLSPQIPHNTQYRKPHILLCFTGSVATVKVPEIAVLLSEFADVRLIASSEAAIYFLDRSNEYNSLVWDEFQKIGGKSLVIPESIEWSTWEKIGDPVVHIELRRWADAVIVAPASADILAKISSGICDSLLLSVLRAWDFGKPAVVCPAMNTLMWEHPATAAALDTLKAWRFDVVLPTTKRLACNDVGSGALAPVSQIVSSLREQLSGKIFEDDIVNSTIAAAIIHAVETKPSNIRGLFFMGFLVVCLEAIINFPGHI